MLIAVLVLVAAGAALLAATPGVGDVEARVHAQTTAHGASDLGLPTPPKIAAALVATEDARFWTNPGIDPAGALAPLNGREGNAGGATLEQQLAKMLYTNPTTTPRARFWRCTWPSPTSATATTGFRPPPAATSTPPDRLDWPQAALLAGLVQAPSAYDPYLHPHLALQRRAQVLQRLVATGRLSAAQARAYATAPLELATGDPASRTG